MLVFVMVEPISPTVINSTLKNILRLVMRVLEILFSKREQNLGQTVAVRTDICLFLYKTKIASPAHNGMLSLKVLHYN